MTEGAQWIKPDSKCQDQSYPSSLRAHFLNAALHKMPGFFLHTWALSFNAY